MIALTGAILRAFLSDRFVAVLTLAAPLAFVTLFGLFFRHLESPDGLHFEIAVVDEARTEDSAALRAALRESGLERVRVRSCAEGEDPPANALAVIVLHPGFSRAAPRVTVRTRAALPGASDAALQLVHVAALRAFSPPRPPVQVTVEPQTGMLLRGSAAGIALMFVMFSAAAVAGRGLGDDATGLPERLRSLGVSGASIVLARLGAMTVIAWGQMALTLGWAGLVFGAVPASPLALVVAAAVGAATCTASVALVANAVGSRTRFAAVAPVFILVVSAFSGSMIPRVLLPEGVARLGSWTYPAWAIDACSAAMEGRWEWTMLGQLAACTACFTLGAVVLRRGRTR